MYKINSEFNFSTGNITSVVNQINSQLKKVDKLSINVDQNAFKNLKKSINELNSSIKNVSSVNVGRGTQSVSGLDKAVVFANRSMNVLKKSTKETETELDRFGKQAAQTIRRFSAFVGVVTIFNSISDGFRSSFREALEFQNQMVKISQVTGLAFKDLGDLDREITRLSTTLGVSSSKIANVSLTLAQAGLSARDTKTALDVLAKTELSATFEDINNTAEGAIAIMSQFKTSAKDLESQLSAVNTVSAKFAVESSDIVTAIRKAGGAFQATGGELNELIALFTSVRATTRESADAIATGLRTIFTRLQRTRTINFLSEMGIDLRNANGEFKGVYESVRILSSALKNLSSSDIRVNQIVEELGGTRQVSRVIPLLKEFATSEKALAIAQRSSNSVTEDAIIAQKSLNVQIKQVVEEFNALNRAILNDTGIQAFIKTTLTLADALIKVGDAARPLLGLLAFTGAGFAAKGAGSLTGSIIKNLRGKQFASGGSVPGHGNGDTVPAMLTPGEFVIKKSAVNAFGKENLQHINRYGNGGIIQRILEARSKSRVQGLGSILQGHSNLSRGQSFSEQLRDLRSPGGFRRSLGIAEDDRLFPNDFSDYTNFGKRVSSFVGGLYNKGKNSVTGYIGSSKNKYSSLTKIITKENRARTAVDEVLKKIENEHGFKVKDVINKVILSKGLNHPLAREGQKVFGTFSPKTKNINLNYRDIKSKKQLESVLFHEYGHAVDNFIGGNGFSSNKQGSILRKIGAERINRLRELDKKIGRKYTGNAAKYRYSPQEAIANIFKQYGTDPVYRKKISLNPDFQKIIQLIKLAKGGSVPGSGNGDTVPALLTPGEFVINKESSRKIGYNNLKKINKYASGGIVGNAGIAALALGPQILSSTAESFGVKTDDVQPFVSALATAGLALFTFSQMLKKDTTALSEELQSLEKDFKDVLSFNSEEIAKTQEQKLKENNIFNQKSAELQKRASATAQNGLGQFYPTEDARNAAAELAKLQEEKIRSDKKDLNIAKLRQKQEAKLQQGLNDKAKQLTQEENFNKTQGRLAIAGAVATAVGSLLTGYAKSNAIAGQKTTGGISTPLVAGAGGLLEGAGIGATGGALIGSAVPVVGTLAGAGIGAAVGGVAGGLNAGFSAQTDLKRFEFNEQFDKFNQNLKNVLESKTTVNAQKINVEQFIKQVNSDFITKTGDELVTLKGNLSGSVDALEEYRKKIVQQGGSADHIIKTNNELILTLSRFGGQSIPEIEERIRNEIKTRDTIIDNNKKYADLQEQNNRRLSAIFNISGAVGDAERGVVGSTNRIDSLRQFTGGFSSISSGFDFSALSNLATANLSDIQSQSTQAGRLIGGPANGLASDINEAAALSQRLPTLLNQLVNSNQLEEGDIVDRVRDAVGQGFGADLIVNKFRDIIGPAGNSTEFLQKFKENPVGVIQEVQAALDPIVESFKDAAPRIVDQLDQFAMGLEESRRNFFTKLDGLGKSIDIAQTQAEFNAAFNNRSFTFDEAQSFDIKRGKLLSGGSTNNELENRLNAAQANILRFQNDLQTADQDELKDLTNAINENVKEAELVTKALEFNADASARLANVQKEFEKTQKTRELKKNLGTSFLFGGAQDKRDLLKGLLGAGQVQANINNGLNPVANMSAEMRQLALGFIQQFAESKVFKDKDGKAIDGNELLKNINEAAGFKIPVTAEEEKLKAQFDAIIESAKQAQDILNTNLTSVNDKFINELGSKFDNFLAGLNKAFADREANSEREAEAAKQGKIAGIDKNIDLLKEIQGLTGINTNSIDNIASAKNSVNLLNQANKLRADVTPIFDAGQQLIKNGFKSTNQIEGVLGKEFIKKLDEDRRTGKFMGESDESINQGLLNMVNQETQRLAQVKVDESNKLELEAKNNSPVEFNKLYENLRRLNEVFKVLPDNVSKKDLRREKEQIESRADGGPVWKKRGSDTVPAMTTDGQPYMLTPGEYVMNRRAVQKYGKNFMNKVNMGYLANGGSTKFRTVDQIAAEVNARPMASLPKQEVPTGMSFRDRWHQENVAKGRALIARSKILRGAKPEKPLVKYNGGKFADINPSNRAKSIDKLTKFQQMSKDGYKTPLQMKNAELAIKRNQAANERRKRTFGQNGNTGLGGQGFFSVPDNYSDVYDDYSSTNELLPKGKLNGNQYRNKSIAPAPVRQVNSMTGKPINKPVNQVNPVSSNPNNLNPKILEEFNKAVEKLNGMKLEVVVTGTLSVNIGEGTLGTKVRESLKVFANEYVMDIVNKEINKLIGDASLGIPQRPIGKKEGAK